MIVRIMSAGTSFKGLSAYLTHDPNADTAERVAWTHTLNCANDHVPSAVDEMVWTARDAELLKQEAGIPAGGRATENTVKHVSLNWAPGEDPSRERMIATTEDFLRHMNWHEHQAILVAHQDKAHSHVHAAINCVHPVTGLKLDDNFERRRAQAWALDYEREHGMIYCGERLKRPEERQAAMHREAWLAFEEKQKAFAQEEKARVEAAGKIDAENPKYFGASEWNLLKQVQRQAREEFFAGGKAAFSEARNAAYGEVRAEFRERWSDYYQAQKNGGDADALTAIKAGLIQEQRERLALRRDEACDALRETRDGQYAGLLAGQREARQELRGWQATGFDEERLQQLLQTGTAREEVTAFRAAAEETVSRTQAAESSKVSDDVDLRGESVASSGLGAAELGGEAAFGIGFGFANFFGGILLDFGETPAAPRARADDMFERAADEAGKRQQYEQQRETDEAWRERERTRVWD